MPKFNKFFENLRAKFRGKQAQEAQAKAQEAQAKAQAKAQEAQAKALEAQAKAQEAQAKAQEAQAKARAQEEALAQAQAYAQAKAKALDLKLNSLKEASLAHTKKEEAIFKQYEDEIKTVKGFSDKAKLNIKRNEELRKNLNTEQNNLQTSFDALDKNVKTVIAITAALYCINKFNESLINWQSDARKMLMNHPRGILDIVLEYVTMDLNINLQMQKTRDFEAEYKRKVDANELDLKRKLNYALGEVENRYPKTYDIEYFIFYVMRIIPEHIRDNRTYNLLKKSIPDHFQLGSGQHSKWIATSKKVTLRNGDVRVLFSNLSKPGELRVRKMVTHNGIKMARYVLPK